jgi:hypothetical protein
MLVTDIRAQHPMREQQWAFPNNGELPLNMLANSLQGDLKIVSLTALPVYNKAGVLLTLMQELYVDFGSLPLVSKDALDTIRASIPIDLNQGLMVACGYSKTQEGRHHIDRRNLHLLLLQNAHLGIFTVLITTWKSTTTVDLYAGKEGARTTTLLVAPQNKGKRCHITPLSVTYLQGKEDIEATAPTAISQLNELHTCLGANPDGTYLANMLLVVDHLRSRMTKRGPATGSEEERRGPQRTNGLAQEKEEA